MVRVEPSGGPCGAFITGVDLGGEVTADDVATIRAAWLEHGVLVFPDQPLRPPEYLRAATYFGRPAIYPFADGIEGFPEIIEVKKLPDETQNFGGVWHSDTTYLPTPPMASLLLARVVPKVGGDTEFANQYLAYEALPEDLRQTVDPLRAVNSSALANDVRVQGDRISDEVKSTIHEAEHPAVRVHPETGRRSIFVNVAHTKRFVGMTERESRPILDALFEHQVRTEFVWRLQWRPDMLTLWDNRCLLHNPVNDYDGHLRFMHRITLEGTVPV